MIRRRTVLLGLAGTGLAAAGGRAVWPRLAPGGDHALPVDFPTLWEYADRAHMPYQSDERIRAYYTEGRVHILHEGEVGTKIVVHQHPDWDHQWVAVRGTQTVADVVQDLQLLETYDRQLGVPVHQGFAALATAALPALGAVLQPGLPVRLAGHSLGGAVAVLLMVALDGEGVAVERCVTFGQPKLTTAAGVRRYRHLPLLRVINGADPIPQMPPHALAIEGHGPYRHLGEELRLDGERWVHLAEPQAERLDREEDWLAVLYTDPRDHLLPSGYMATINLQLPPEERKPPG